MSWAKVKFVTYLPEYQENDNLIISALVEFGIGEESTSQTAFAKEVDLIQDTVFEGPYLPLEEVDSAAALTMVETALGTEQLELLKMKAEMFFIQSDTKFFND